MKILAIGDSHLGYRYGRTPEARTFIEDQFFANLEYCINQALNNSVDVFLHTGDIFNRSQPPSSLVGRFYDHIERLLQADVQVVLVPGNHDRAYLPNNLLEFYYSNLHIVNKPSRIDLDEIDVVGFPFEYESPRKIFKKVVDMVSPKPTILMCHQLFAGATFGPQQFTFFDQDDVITAEQIPKSLQIITGHIHRAQNLFDGQVLYTGSTSRTSFAEVIEPKGYLFGKVTSNSIQLEFKQIPTMDMQVIEWDYNANPSIESLVDYIVPGLQVRTLVRMVNTTMASSLLRNLNEQFTADNYPLLSISPRKLGRRLTRRFSIYQQQFQFNPVSRHFEIHNRIQGRS